MSSNGTRMIQFGVFEVDLRAGELRRNGSRVKLQEQPLQILTLLLERPGEVVSREELRTRLWPADTFVDFDHSLNAAAAGFGTHWETVPRTRVLLRPWRGVVTGFWCRSAGCRPLSRPSFRFLRPGLPVPGGLPRRRLSCLWQGWVRGCFWAGGDHGLRPHHHPSSSAA